MSLQKKGISRVRLKLVNNPKEIIRKREPKVPKKIISEKAAITLYTFINFVSINLILLIVTQIKVRTNDFASVQFKVVFHTFTKEYLTMKTKSFLIGASLLSASLTSCSVYYTTSEVDSNLKSTVDQVNSTIQKLESQIGEMEKEYHQITCDNPSMVFVQAHEMLANIDAELKAIDAKKAHVNQVYAQFKEYSKGKERIQSGTPEWDQVKHSKETLKLTLEDIQTEGNKVVEDATAFNSFVTKSIVPTIQLCDVAQYTAQFEKAIADLSVNQKQVGEQLSSFQKQVAELISKHSKTKPELCKELSSDLQKINTDVTQISRIKMNLQLSVNTFKTSTQGKTKIYSCSSDWKFVTEAENAVNAQQKEANALQQSIQTTATHLQSVVQALGQ